jgi:hypothetical protein
MSGREPRSVPEEWAIDQAPIIYAPLFGNWEIEIDTPKSASPCNATGAKPTTVDDNIAPEASWHYAQLQKTPHSR